MMHKQHLLNMKMFNNYTLNNKDQIQVIFHLMQV
jgi:hypothetical protein